MIPRRVMSEEYERAWLEYEAASKRANDRYHHRDYPPCYCGAKKPRKQQSCAKCRRAQEKK